MENKQKKEINLLDYMKSFLKNDDVGRLFNDNFVKNYGLFYSPRADLKTQKQQLSNSYNHCYSLVKTLSSQFN